MTPSMGNGPPNRYISRRKPASYDHLNHRKRLPGPRRPFDQPEDFQRRSWPLHAETSRDSTVDFGSIVINTVVFVR